MCLSPAAYDRLTQVVHLYLTVADPSRVSLEPHERQLAVHLSRQWEPETSLHDVEAIVDTAYAATRSGLQPGVGEVAQEVCRLFPPGDTHRLLKDLGLMAAADGHLTQHEAEVIGQVRAAFRTAQGPPAA